MILDITRGIQNKGIEVRLCLEEKWEKDQWRGDTLTYISPVAFEGSYLITEDTVVVRGRATVSIEAPCARCLESARLDVAADIEEAYIRDRNGDLDQQRSDDEQYTYSGHCIDLTDAVRSALLLELPSRILCKEDCRGLCPICGVNLNNTTCSCQKDPARRNPFSALAELLNEDEEV